MNTDIAIEPLNTYSESIQKALEKIAAQPFLAKQKAIMIKPNLVNASPYPVTTPPVCCEAIIQFIRSFSDAQIVIAEGTGDASIETSDVFQALGYQELSEKMDVPLIDLNHEPLIRLTDSTCTVFKEIFLPECVFNYCVISVPVLKAHSLSIITGSLKNMIGIAPPRYYSGKFGIWKKAVFHGKMHESIVDLNRYRKADLSIMDAGIGLSEYHLGGAECRPHVKKILAGFDPVLVDRAAAGLLGIDWNSVPHLK
ncbi:protein containing DUF362 [Candidatus Magnetomorum sp. HK-1]|nr:protein containing DUF362 [Candidatus Magnetomorum sp. HK-1]